MILGGKEVLKKLEEGQIFVDYTWVKESVKEASYALRVAGDGLMLDGEQYSPGNHFPGQYLESKPGRIAILSTIERLNMPNNLVGKLGIRLNYALQGLTGLMGIQVDPNYGRDVDDERLFIRVANFGNEPIKLLPGDPVFTFEVHDVGGEIQLPPKPRGSAWERLQRDLAIQNEASWTYVTRVESDLRAQGQILETRLRSDIENIRNSLQPVVMFGVFLVAVTILGVAFALILGVRGTPDVEVPDWVTDWGWILLLVTLSLATLATAFVGVAAGLRILWPSSDGR